MPLAPLGGRALIGLALLTLGACAQCGGTVAADWTGAGCAEVVLDEDGIRPARIVLPQGRPVRLHIVNRSPQNRDFRAPRFFATVAPRTGEGLLAIAGAIEVPGHGSRDIVVVPVTPGAWPLGSGPATPFRPPALIVVTPDPG